jgi:hypothetical protein
MSEAPGTTTSAMILALPPELLERVARCLDRRDDVCSLRLACSGLRGPATLAVRRLRTRHGVLPAEAWAAFPAANGLVIDLGFHSTAALLPGLPERVEGLSIESSTDAFLLQLLSAPLAQRLRHLKAYRVLPETARRLLAGLPRLQRCELSLCWSGPVLLSQFPAELQQLDLGDMQGARSCRIDCAALAACTQLDSFSIEALVDQLEGLSAFLQAAHGLEHLDLQLWRREVSPYGGYVRSQAELTDTEWQLLAAMPRLQSLYMREAQATAAQWRLPGAMPSLQSLYLPCAELTAAQWEALAATPSLRELDLATIELASGASPAAALTKLSASRLQLPEGAPPGMLATLLPRLRHIDLHAQDDSRLDVVAALRGHPALEQLDIGFDSHSGLPEQQQPWPAGVLSSMPQLRTVRLEGMRCRGIDALLQDAAGCPQLEALQVRLATFCSETMHKERLQEPATDAGLAALAGGACRDTLRRLVLDTQAWSFGRVRYAFHFKRRQQAPPMRPDPGASFSVAAVAQLLGALPQLQELQADVQLPREGSGGGDTTGADESEGEEGEEGGEGSDGGEGEAGGEEGGEGEEGGQSDVAERLRQRVQLLLGEAGVAAQLTCTDATKNWGAPRPPAGARLCGAAGGCKLQLCVWLRKGEQV